MSTTLEEFRELVEAVLRVHRPVWETDHAGARWQVCEHCWTGNPWCTTSASWPCPTVAEIAKYVDVDKVLGRL